MTRRLFATLLSATCCVGATAGPSNMQPGLWEITTETEVAGSPMKLPADTIRHCYTKQELEQAQNTVPSGTAGNCKVSDYTLKGNTATWRIECSGQADIRGTGTMTTEPTAFSGSSHSVMAFPGGTMETTSHWRARRIGDCR